MEIRRNIIRFSAVFLVFLFVSLTAGAIKSFAGSGNACEGGFNKRYTSILIYPGDTIESLVSDYSSEGSADRDSLAKEILSINHLSPDKDLQPGNHIIVPVYLNSSNL